MKKKKTNEIRYAVQWGKLKLTYRVVVTIFVMIIIGLVLIINIGYDRRKGGCYWKPADVTVEIRRVKPIE